MHLQSSDEQAIRDLAEAMRAAEASFDPRLFETVLAVDAVIMPPGTRALEGCDACLEFIRAVLADNAQEFSRRDSTQDIVELRVFGDTAIDRGRFRQTLTRRENGERVEEEGQFLRVYSRAPAGDWKVARIIWNLLGDDEVTA